MLMGGVNVWPLSLLTAMKASELSVSFHTIYLLFPSVKIWGNNEISTLLFMLMGGVNVWPLSLLTAMKASELSVSFHTTYILFPSTSAVINDDADNGENVVIVPATSTIAKNIALIRFVVDTILLFNI